MPEQTAKELVAELTKSLPPHKYAQAGIAKIWPELLKEPKEAMEAALTHFILNSTYLPSPGQLLAKVQAEGQEIRKEEARQREREWEKEKPKRTDETVFDRQYHDKQAQRAVQLLRLTLRAADREVVLEGLRAMEGAYPGAGYGKAGVEIQRRRKQREDGEEARL